MALVIDNREIYRTVLDCESVVHPESHRGRNRRRFLVAQKFSKDKYPETHVSFPQLRREYSRRRGAAVAPAINSQQRLWWRSDEGSVFLTLPAREIPRFAMGVGCRTGRTKG
jgi:hypothetical protein